MFPHLGKTSVTTSPLETVTPFFCTGTGNLDRIGAEVILYSWTRALKHPQYNLTLVIDMLLNGVYIVVEWDTLLSHHYIDRIKAEIQDHECWTEIFQCAKAIGVPWIIHRCAPYEPFCWQCDVHCQLFKNCWWYSLVFLVCHEIGKGWKSLT